MAGSVATAGRWRVAGHGVSQHADLAARCQARAGPEGPSSVPRCAELRAAGARTSRSGVLHERGAGHSGASGGCSGDRSLVRDRLGNKLVSVPLRCGVEPIISGGDVDTLGVIYCPMSAIIHPIDFQRDYGSAAREPRRQVHLHGRPGCEGAQSYDTTLQATFRTLRHAPSTQSRCKAAVKRRLRGRSTLCNSELTLTFAVLDVDRGMRRLALAARVEPLGGPQAAGVRGAQTYLRTPCEAASPSMRAAGPGAAHEGVPPVKRGDNTRGGGAHARAAVALLPIRRGDRPCSRRAPDSPPCGGGRGTGATAAVQGSRSLCTICNELPAGAGFTLPYCGRRARCGRALGLTRRWLLDRGFCAAPGGTVVAKALAAEYKALWRSVRDERVERKQRTAL